MKRIRTLSLAAIAISMMSVTPIDASAAPATTPFAQGSGSPQVAGDRRGDPTDLEAASATDVAKAHRKIELANGPGVATYLVRLADPAVPSYKGGKAGLPATAPESGQRLDTDSAPVVEYTSYLVAEQTDFVSRVGSAIGRTPNVPFTYQLAVNGLAIDLTAEEVLAIADDPSVVSITPDVQRVLHSDAGPEWIEADQLWNGTVPGLTGEFLGEGIIIGTIDTGISPFNRSFADVGDDGYDHTNPLGDGVYVGVCDSTDPSFDPTFPCNDKLIGAWEFGNLNNGSAIDNDGHGSHTASTSGGSVVEGVTVTTASGYTTPAFDISGVAPHANVISYLGCCSLAGLTASIQQAIDDGVDVINYSIGSSAASAAWDDFDTVGFLNARNAGIFVATSNGNDGPNDATTGSPADAPWITSVGATTHNRHNGKLLTGLTSTSGPLADIEGKGVTGGLVGTAPIVDGASVGDPLCTDTAATPNASYAGAIVICVRGTNGRVEKSQNVAAQGAVGFILINDELNGDSLLGDEYAVPGLFISFDDGEVLRDWLAVGDDHVGTITETNFEIDDARADYLTSFSSRGPNRAMDVIVPSVSAPGADILAAVTDLEDPTGGDIHGFISGTSMASPHVAGAGALLTDARPSWSPAEMQSALMTTAVTSTLNHDGTPATPYQQGSGRIDVARAVMAGLLFDETNADYLAANPAEGGDPKTLNTPSFANSQCLVICEWEREANVPLGTPADVTWTASVVSDPGLTLTVELSDATVSATDVMGITVTANVAGASEDETLFGRITLASDNELVPDVTMPVAVIPSSGVVPESVDIDTRRDAGSEVVTGIQSVELTEFTGSLSGWVEGTQIADELAEDSTNASPYDDLSEVGVYLVDVAAGSESLVAEILESAAADLDLFVGTGSTPSAATEVCVSASGTALEYCEVAEPAAGTWWIVVQNWASVPVPANPPLGFVLSHAVVPSASLGNGDVVGPAGTVPTGEFYDISVTWDLADAEEGDVFYAVATLGSSPATPDNIGSFPVRLARVADDVTKESSTASAASGDDVDYDITVQPNVTPTDLEYTIVDTVPDGMTIDPASVTSGGVIDGQTITWTVTMPTAVGSAGGYVLSTPAESVECANWAGFLDLAPSIPLNTLDGDTTYGTFFNGFGPFEIYGEQYPNLTVAEDGFVTVTNGYGDPNEGDEPWVPQELPDVTVPNGVIAPLWADLELSLANNRGIRTATIGSLGAAIIQWDNPFEYTPSTATGPSVGQFQAWIYTAVSETRPEMTFEYNTLGALPAEATIGIENLAGTLATSVVNADDPAPALEAGGTYCLDYVVPEFPPTTLEYSVSVDSPVTPGVVTNTVEHITDDPFAEPAVASADVELLGGSIAVDPTTLDFGDVAIGESATADVTVTNDGSGDLTITGAAASAPFTVDATACTGAALAPSGTCDLSVTFTPTVGGPATGTLQIASDAGSAPDVALIGNGTSVELSVDAANVNFGDVLVGASETSTVVVTNEGTGPLTITDASTAAPYSVDATDCLTPVAPQGTCELSITFTPAAEGPAVGSLIITSDASGSPHTVALAGNGYVPEAISPIVPARYWDTRDELTVDELFRNTGDVPGGTSYQVQVAGRGAVPGGATAVVANLTAIEPNAEGFATMYPCTDDVPLASHVNYFADDVVANSAIVPLDADGAICVYTLATSDFALDISGYLAADSPVEVIEPARYLETRDVPGYTTFDRLFEAEGRVLANTTLEVQIGGRGEIPVDAAAALMNVTAVDPDAEGFLTVFPCGERPTTSTVNYFAGEFVPNGAVADLSNEGTVCIYSYATTDVLIDVSGYVPADTAGLSTMVPARLLDTREGELTIDNIGAGTGRLLPDSFVEVQVTGRAQIPENATAAILNVGVVNPDGPGFATLYPCGEIPLASNVNYTEAGAVRANNSITQLSDDGSVCIYTYAGADLILDVTGWVD